MCTAKPWFGEGPNLIYAGSAVHPYPPLKTPSHKWTCFPPSNQLTRAPCPFRIRPLLYSPMSPMSHKTTGRALLPRMLRRITTTHPPQNSLTNHL